MARLTRKQQIEKRTQMLVQMHNLVMSLNNEDAYMRWIWVIPDGADEGELRDIAGNFALVDEAAKLFTQLIKDYGDDGYCLGGGKVYGTKGEPMECPLK